MSLDELIVVEDRKKRDEFRETIAARFEIREGCQGSVSNRLDCVLVDHVRQVTDRPRTFGVPFSAFEVNYRY